MCQQRRLPHRRGRRRFPVQIRADALRVLCDARVAR
jgi:hypothetical protein